MAKIIFGIICGVLLSLLLYFCYYLGKQKREDTVYFAMEKVASIVNEKSKFKSANTSELMEEKLKNAVNEEKINTLNTRFNDLYVLGGIIVTVLLAINLGVYIKTEQEVAKHFTDNYSEYKNQIEEKLTESTALVQKIKAEYNSVEELKKNNEQQTISK